MVAYIHTPIGVYVSIYVCMYVGVCMHVCVLTMYVCMRHVFEVIF